MINGYQRERRVQLGKSLGLKTYEIAEWNPLLLAISRGHLEIVKLLFEHDATR